MTLLRNLLLLALAGLLTLPGAHGAAISNEAAGTVNGIPLSRVRARVDLTRVSSAVTSAWAEISPNRVTSASTGNAFAYDILPTIGPGDSGVSRIDITAPPGYSNLAVTGVEIGGAAWTASCPVPGPNQYCATVSGSAIAVVLGTKVRTTQTDLRVLFTADAPTPLGSAAFTSTVTDGPFTNGTVEGDADRDAGDANSLSVEVVASQGLVLGLAKSAAKREALVGEVVTYLVEIRNTVPRDVRDVRIADSLPPNFRYVAGSARLDGAPLADPTGHRPIEFSIGDVPALDDRNGNGAADPGEPGYRLLAYQLVVGSGALPGGYENTVVATDYCDTCLLSARASASVQVRLDPTFDLGTILGKVFEDRNSDGVQQREEPGVPEVFVALDDGTYALTDEHGRYHFPAVRPGHRMVKIDLKRLPPGSLATNGESRVLWATPGLMLTADFGVTVRLATESIGTPDEPGLAVRAAAPEAPVSLRGNVESLSLLVDGSEVRLPAGDVRLTRAGLDGTVRLEGPGLDGPARFELDAGGPAAADSWSLTIAGSDGAAVKSFGGSGAPPSALEWDGRRDDGRLVASGEIYAYQLEVTYADGAATTSPRRLFGVDRSSVTAIQLTGEAFETGKAELSPRARKSLDEAASAFRRQPDEKILIEGHTDWVGSSESNLALSKARAESARRYLVEQGKLAPERFVLAWHGEERPVAPNDTPEGRALNRRVVIEGELKSRERARILDAFRVAPEVRIGGAAIEPGERGRFAAPLPTDPAAPIAVSLRDQSGRSVKVVVPVPTVAITAPTGERLLAYGAGDGTCTAGRPAGGSWATGESAVVCALRGTTEPGNGVEVEGRPVEVDPSGAFATDVSLRIGGNTVGIVARDARGVIRVANLPIEVADRDDDDRLLVASAGVPALSVDLPPRDATLSDPRLVVRGRAEPGGRVTINDAPAELRPDGTFSAVVELPRGPGDLVVRVTDPRGREGSVTRPVTVAKHQLFLMALADGTVGRMRTRGHLAGAGRDDASDYYTEGRVAYYLKGVIAGKYLVTSAFDSATNGGSELFGDLDRASTERLITNLDPDRYYPVYGDDSSVVWDAESRGKFYLALDGETVHAVVGDYPLSLSDTELAPYRRTLYGGRFAYRSASRTSLGDPDTELVVFGAEVKYAHVRDEIRGTGGSLYYLSRRHVVEGSEEVTVVVRDKNTGLLLSSERQRRNLDYVVKYEEGRVMFQRPISSVVPGGSIVDQATLQGNPVTVLVDYEVALDAFEKTASGGRVRRRLGDRVSVGGTYVQDELESGSYELRGVDAHVRIGRGSKVYLEAADASGSDSVVNVSEDGGLRYVAAAAAGATEGSAWKAAADLDVGEWFGTPDRYRVRAYRKQLDPGFFSSGNAQEQGSTKTGIEVALDVTAGDSVRLRFDRDERSAGSPLGGAAAETTTSAAQWTRTRKRWGLAAELFDSASRNGATTLDRTYAAAHFWSKVTEKLTARFEHQATLSGPDHDRTAVGVQYQALPNLALELIASDGTGGSSAQAGAIYTRGETSIYLTERLADSSAGETTTTVLGAKSPLGRSSRVYTEYQWEDADTGGRTVSLVGLERQWDPTPGLRFLLSGEKADATGTTGTTDRTTVAGGVSWRSPRGIQATSRQEIRFESGASRRRQYFTVNQLDYKIGTDVTLLARLRYSRTDDRERAATDARLDERSVGAAYRPVRHARFNALFKYTSLLDQRPLQTAADLRTTRRMDVFSVDTSFRVTPRVEWLAKEATRVLDETVGDLPGTRTSTWLVVQRVNVRVWRAMNVAAEYRLLSQREADDRREGWLTEAMWEFMRNFSVGVGYNFTDFSDNLLAADDYRTDGWFFRVQARY